MSYEQGPEKTVPLTRQASAGFWAASTLYNAVVGGLALDTVKNGVESGEVKQILGGLMVAGVGIFSIKTPIAFWKEMLR